MKRKKPKAPKKREPEDHAQQFYATWDQSLKNYQEMCSDDQGNFDEGRDS